MEYAKAFTERDWLGLRSAGNRKLLRQLSSIQQRRTSRPRPENPPRKTRAAARFGSRQQVNFVDSQVWGGRLRSVGSWNRFRRRSLPFLSETEELRELRPCTAAADLKALGLARVFECADRRAIEPLHLPQLLEAVLARRGANGIDRPRPLKDNPGSHSRTSQSVCREKDVPSSRRSVRIKAKL